MERLLRNAGIIRSRSKVEATIGNVCAYLPMLAAGEDFSEFCWRMVSSRPLRGKGAVLPITTPLTEAISVALKKRGSKS